TVLVSDFMLPSEDAAQSHGRQRPVAGDKCSALSAGSTSATPAFRHLRSTASKDHSPGPFSSKNMAVSICAYSDRISCNTAHNPPGGGAGGSGKGDFPRYREIFVERIAKIISATKGIVIRRVLNPASNNNPPTISRPPTNVAVKCGNGI